MKREMPSGGHRSPTAFILWPFSPSKKSPLDPPSPWGWLGAYLHILIAPEMTVRDGHALSHRVRRAILDAIPEVTDVVIHVEPFNGGPLP